MRWTSVALVFLVAGGLHAEPDPKPASEPVSAPSVEEFTLKGLDRKDWKEYLGRFSEEQLGQILNGFGGTGGGYAGRAVSRALGWRILDRRTARLRALAPSDGALGEAPCFGVLQYPRTDGSTSTIPLERLIACRLFGSPYAWGGPEHLRALQDPFVGPPNGGPIGLGGRKRKPPIAERAARGAIVADATAPGNERLGKLINHLLVRHSGTHGAWVNLIEGSADLVFVARGPSPDETKLAVEKDVRLDAAPLARDALIFLVNRVNPVDSLTLDQIRAIYTESIVNWEEVGGTPAAIEAFQRNRSSGSQELFLSRVMGDVSPRTPAKELIRDSMVGPYNAIYRRPHALGYTVWYYERYMASIPEVRPLALGGIAATPETIADGSYPIVTTVYAAIRADEPVDSPARRLREWLLTDEGQAVVAESGYVPIR